MRLILAELTSLILHNHLLETAPEQFTPEQCPHCGKSGLWRHGSYPRKADFDNPCSESLNPVSIPRFRCPQCHHTCSVLPECIPPNRHYPWLIQQIVLLLIINGASYQSASQQSKPSRRTISRWVRRLKSRFLEHADHLRSLLSTLGSLTELIPFWDALLERFSLSRVMLNLNNNGVVIP